MKNKFLAIVCLGLATLVGCGGGGGGSNATVDTGGTVTNPVTSFSRGNLLNGPVHMAFYGPDLYVVSNGNDKILKIDSAGVQTDLAVPVHSPLGIAFDPNNAGLMYVSAVANIVEQSGVYPVLNLSSGPRLGSSLVSPGINYYGITFAGPVLYAVNQPSQVLIAATGSTSIALISTPTGLLSANSFVYVTRNAVTGTGADLWGVKKINANTQEVTNFASSALFNRPNAIVLNSATGDFYVANTGTPGDPASGRVLKVSADGLTVTSFLTHANGVCAPTGLAINGGVLYVGNGPCTSGGESFILKTQL
jgi:hypothetical protein